MGRRRRTKATPSPEEEDLVYDGDEAEAVFPGESEPASEYEYEMDPEFSYIEDSSLGPRPKSTPTAELRSGAEKARKRLEREGHTLSPVSSRGRKIAQTFWGQAWCKNLESYQDYETRLPRGRSYLRAGGVIDLRVEQGLVKALVCGQELYEVEVTIEPLERTLWAAVAQGCGSSIATVVELLSGELSDHVMRLITDPEQGIFPEPSQIRFSCTCPDWAEMCKHVAAALYGVGARLDTAPELFFTLRGVDPAELIAGSSGKLGADAAEAARDFDATEIETLFGIDVNLEDEDPTPLDG